jgi:hypothetical protein
LPRISGTRNDRKKKGKHSILARLFIYSINHLLIDSSSHRLLHFPCIFYEDELLFISELIQFIDNRSKTIMKYRSQAILLSSELIEKKIFLIRGEKVMIDFHLAELYGVSTKALVQAVKRNSNRFPVDFAFQLNTEEFLGLRSQIVTSKRGGRRFLPFVFTEQGVAMLSSVLRSERAIEVNVAIMRGFVRLREILSTNKELARKLGELEQKFAQHDSDIQAIFDAIRQLMASPEKPKREIACPSKFCYT